MILFILPKHINAGIITSQHIVVARKLSSKIPVRVAIHNKFKGPLSGDINTELDVIWYGSYRELWKHLNGCSWVYVRSLYSFFPVYFRKLISSGAFKIFYDFRALSYIEVEYVQRSKIKKYLFYCMEFLCYHLSDAIGAISKKLFFKLKATFGNRPVYIMPCCVDKVRALADIELVKSRVQTKHLRFVYVGSINKWQCFDDILSIYRTISESIPSQLSVITGDVDKATREINNFFPKRNMNVEVQTLSHAEVMAVLPTFDFGFLIREFSPINNLASPVKFLEYTSNGVIPIMTQGIGDYSDLVKSNCLGIVLDSSSAIKVQDIVALSKDSELLTRLHLFSKNYVFDNYINDHPLNEL